MMNCRESAKILVTLTAPHTGRQAQPVAEGTAHEAREHLTDCAKSRRRWSLERMAVTLIRAHAGAQGEPPFPSPYFFTRLRARIQAEQAEPGAAFWEEAVATARGWLVVFGSVTAILLAAFIFTWQAENLAPEFSNEALALPASN